MSRTSEYVEPGASPWHLLGAEIRHWREDIQNISLRETAQKALIDHGDLSKWERGRAHPHPSAVKRLDEALGAKGHLVALQAFSADLDRLRTLEGKGTGNEETATERRHLFQLAASLALGSVGGAEPVRQLLDQDEGRHVEEWDMACSDHLYALRTRPPAQVAADLAVDLLALRHQMKTTTAADLIELRRTLATLSTFHANALTRMADHGAALRWWRTARHAAEASGDLTKVLMVRQQEAIHGLYGQRSPETVLRLIQETQQLAGRPSVHLMTPEAKALSMLGRHKEAITLVRRLPDFAMTTKRDPLGLWMQDGIHFASSWVYSAAGADKQAHAEGEAVLSQTNSFQYHANATLHGALCTVVKGGIREGCEQAAAVITSLPLAYRSNHVLATGRRVLHAVPLDQRNCDAAGELRAALAI